ncbi:prepilin-type N-terminal cleavage/methylation domain-containing protein [Paraburkholderia sp. Ac-20340]|uniref:PulJ/GspJ family protein n=1 Tax=Paraburkholderia sp. Ac-20340 TaxID=2703888 RepID=UPI00197FD15C|nr:prepilin-type N-terminal cleavage/methylation domain-containing protein [Paraburkholderia sp. Ac-20340]MBN3855855.1 prepilin-type N-terminal cleavage/methylation domain-containing protein [Paraburkholderia sp. Ac-20340]
MKSTVRSNRRAVRHVGARAGARTGGFTLLELLVAVAILAVVAVLAWRGLDAIARGRDSITRSMADERVFAQLFDQMRIDARLAVSDDETGGSAIAADASGLQIVRTWPAAAGEAPRLEVVRYHVADGLVIRYASPPIGNFSQLRHTMRKGEDSTWSSVALMNGVNAIQVRMYVPKTGWTTQMTDVRSAIVANDNNLTIPQLAAMPLPRAVTGLRVSIRAASLTRPVDRAFLVGE